MSINNKQSQSMQVVNSKSEPVVLYTRKEAAAYLGIAEQTLAVWKCTGRYYLPCAKIGRIVRYRKSDLDSFITKHMQGMEQPRFS